MILAPSTILVRRAFDSETYTSGLIVTTVWSASEGFQSALDHLREQSGKPVGLILAADLAAIFMRYRTGRRNFPFLRYPSPSAYPESFRRPTKQS